MNTLKFGNGEWYGKKDTILAYNDENSNYKPLPFDFSRASKATVINKDGLIEEVGSGQPRVDYKDDSKGALLLEPSRSNLVPYSENFNSGWSQYGSPTINISSIISPDGTLNGSNITRGSNATPLRYQSLTSTGTQYTFSLYAKKGSVDKIYLDIGDVADVEFTLTDEWQRFEITQTPTNFTHIDISFGTSTSGDNFYIYGAQLEAGSYATSYIPTQGSAVTRVADDMPNHLNINPLNLGNSYTLFLDADLNKVVNNKVFCEIENSASNDVFSIRNTIGQIRVYNNLDSQYPTGNLQSNTNRWAIRIDGNSYKIFGADNSLSGTLPTARNIGEIKFYGSSTDLKINNFNIYNTALSDAECEALVN